MRNMSISSSRSPISERGPIIMPSQTAPNQPSLSARPAPEKRSRGGVFVLVLVLVTFVSLGAAYYSYSKLSEFKKNPQKLTQDEIAAVVAEVSQIMVLPQGEQPTLATVADPERLKGQAFFANAKVGDKVLFYPTSRKAILYDPVAKKIVEVAPINIGDAAPAPASPSAGMETTQPAKR